MADQQSPPRPERNTPGSAPSTIMPFMSFHEELLMLFRDDSPLVRTVSLPDDQPVVPAPRSGGFRSMPNRRISATGESTLQSPINPSGPSILVTARDYITGIGHDISTHLTGMLFDRAANAINTPLIVDLNPENINKFFAVYGDDRRYRYVRQGPMFFIKELRLDQPNHSIALAIMDSKMYSLSSVTISAQYIQDLVIQAHCKNANTLNEPTTSYNQFPNQYINYSFPEAEVIGYLLNHGCRFNLTIHLAPTTLSFPDCRPRGYYQEVSELLGLQAITSPEFHPNLEVAHWDQMPRTSNITPSMGFTTKQGFWHVSFLGFWMGFGFHQPAHSLTIHVPDARACFLGLPANSTRFILHHNALFGEEGIYDSLGPDDIRQEPVRPLVLFREAMRLMTSPNAIIKWRFTIILPPPEPRDCYPFIQEVCPWMHPSRFFRTATQAELDKVQVLVSREYLRRTKNSLYRPYAATLIRGYGEPIRFELQQEKGWIQKGQVFDE